MITAGESFFHYLILSTHVTIRSSLQIHWLTELQLTLDSLWTEIKHLRNLLGNFTIIHIHMATSISIHIDADRLSHTNSITYLHQHFISHTCSYHVLGNIASSVSSRTVHLT